MIGLAEYPESRRKAFTDALDAAGIAWTTDLSESDIIICGRRKAKLLKHRKPLYYRLRGNLWRDREPSLLKKVIDPVSWRAFENVLCPDYRLRNWVAQKTPFDEAPVVPLSIQPDEWPAHEHTDTELRMLSLTNANYEGKVTPIVERIKLVNEWCDRNSGEWWICGKGEYADRIKRATAGREYVSYCGYVNAREYLKGANALLHFSTMDIQAPNAVLEGMASEIPVVTSENNIFQELPSPMVNGQDSLIAELDRLKMPEIRSLVVQGQQSYLQKHSPEQVGKQIQQIL